MFHWLKQVGGSIEDAYRYFEQFKGKQSYLELHLIKPTPTQRDNEEDH